MHAYDLNDERLPDLDDDAAAEMVRVGLAAWIKKGKVVRCATDDNLEDLRGDCCVFCGATEDLVTHGCAATESDISASDFETICRPCRQNHRWMNRKQFDTHVAEQFVLLAEFAVRYPGSCMALVRVFSGGKDIIGYANLQQLADSIMALEGWIVTSRARNSFHFEYYGPPQEREPYEEWVRDWLFNHFEGRCHFCNCTLKRGEITLDHLIPLTRRGSNSVTNIAVCCHWCNQDKGTMKDDEYEQYLERRRQCGRRLGIVVDILGDRCVEYQRCVSHRPDDGRNRINPLIKGEIQFDRECGREEFEQRYCSRCVNDRCSRMSITGFTEEQNVGSDDGTAAAPEGGDSLGVGGGDGFGVGGVVEAGSGDEHGAGVRGGLDIQDEEDGAAGVDRLERRRRERRRIKRHGKPRGH